MDYSENSEPTETELQVAARAMHHTREMHQNAYTQLITRLQSEDADGREDNAQFLEMTMYHSKEMQQNVYAQFLGENTQTDE